jgi:membrane-associated protein
MGFLLIVAAITGNTINYTLGNFLGQKVFKPGNRILKLEYYEKTKEYFNKKGGNMLIFSRFMPVFRTLAPFVAVVGKMKFGPFTYYNVVGGVLWIASFLGIGFIFGNIPFIKDNFTYVMLVIIILTVLPAVIAAFKARNSLETGKL